MGIAGSTEWRDVPNEDGERIQFKELGFRALRAARLEAQHSAYSDWKAMGGDILQALQARQQPTDAAARPVDPLSQYDQQTLLVAGIVGWTFTKSDAAGVTHPIPVTPETISDLTEPVANWAAREILLLAGVIDPNQTTPSIVS